MKFFLYLFLLTLPFGSFAKDNVIEELISTYNANQARFHLQFKSKQIKGNAKVTSIKADPLGMGVTFYVDLDIFGSKVMCITENRNMAASLNINEEVTYDGFIEDVVFNKLIIKNCNVTKINIDSKRNYSFMKSTFDKFVIQANKGIGIEEFQLIVENEKSLYIAEDEIGKKIYCLKNSQYGFIVSYFPTGIGAIKNMEFIQTCKLN